MGRRPTIRRRPISKPRVRSQQQLHTAPLALPQPAPLPRPLPPPARRPTLVLVEEEELRAPLAAQLAPMRAPALTWFVASVVAVAIAAGIGVAWLWSRPAEVAQVPAVVATTTLNAATVAAPPIAAKGVAPVAAAVPELDVNSLPAAPPSNGRAR